MSRRGDWGTGHYSGEWHMIAGLLALMLVSADTTMRISFVSIDSVPVAHGSTESAATRTGLDRDRSSAVESITAPRSPWLAADTLVRKKKPALVSYSDWYGRRLAVHKTLSWTMLPLFAVSYYTGTAIARDGRQNVSSTVRNLHPYAATGAAVVFGVNTVTGVWNLWDSRHDPNGRTRRIIHSALFLIADAGFAYAGSIGREGREDGAVRNRHRTIALSSMGVSTAGWLIMLLGQ